VPIYEFKCNACGHVFDELCKMGETGEALTCPKCKSVGARLLISAFAAHGLENGFMGIGKTWGNSSGGSKSKDSSESTSAAKSGGDAGSSAAD
jgi:putative FmdB family regulatory protein